MVQPRDLPEMCNSPSTSSVLKLSYQAAKLFHRRASLTDQRSQGSLGKFAVVGNRNPAVRGLGMAKNHVTAVLAV